jgi:hypothetical protein
MLQMITKKVESEGKEADKLHDQFMCECSKTQASLADQIATGEASGSDQAAALEAGKAHQAQMTQDIVDAKNARAAAKEAIATSTAIREKEAKAFSAAKADSEANIAAMSKALDAIHKGVGASFIQSDAAKVLGQLVQNKQDLFSDNREEVEDFLQNGVKSEFSGEIIGVLDQLKETMSKDLADAEATEKDAIATYNEFVAAKNREFETLQASIESKMARLGELGVANSQLSNSGGDTGSSVAADKKTLAELKADCEQRQNAYEAEKKSRVEELAALADTVKMLNDDDALDLFKKALPSGSSFVQMTSRDSVVRTHVMSMVKAAQHKHSKSTQLDFIALALRGKKVGFDKVVALIDKMVNQLMGEQVNDDARKQYCLKEFDEADDEKKVLQRKVHDAETAIMDAKESIQTLTEEISSTQAAIVENDKFVEEATAQRQEENAAYKTLMTENTAALELIKMAKNRMNKFYNPSLYVAPPKRELSREDRIAVNMGGTAPPTPAPGGIAGTGIMAFIQVHDQKKGEEANGVIAMMDLLLKDLEGQMTVAETDEKNAQEDYTKAIFDAKEKRTADSKLLAEKVSAKAEADAALEKHTEDKTGFSKELLANGEYIASLHADCDWLLEHFDQRKEARNDEIDAMKKAKDVLNGADYSLLEVGTARSLRGSK